MKRLLLTSILTLSTPLFINSMASAQVPPHGSLPETNLSISQLSLNAGIPNYSATNPVARFNVRAGSISSFGATQPYDQVFLEVYTDNSPALTYNLKTDANCTFSNSLKMYRCDLSFPLEQRDLTKTVLPLKYRYYVKHGVTEIYDRSSAFVFGEPFCGTLSSPLYAEGFGLGNKFKWSFNPTSKKTCATEFFIDSETLAQGFTYHAIGGPDFTQVTMPPLSLINDTDGYELLFQDSSGSNTIPIAAGTIHVFTEGVDEFTIQGIDTALSVQSFPTGIKMHNTNQLWLEQQPLSAPVLCNDQFGPLIPTALSSGGFDWTITTPNICPGNFFIDPPVASGYEYSAINALFLSITAPEFSVVPDPDGYIVEYENGGNLESDPLLVGGSFTFPSPVSKFKLKEINPDLSLNPNDELAFPLGIDLSNPTSFKVKLRQVPIVTNYTGNSNNPPVANAGPDQTGQAPHSFNLDGTGSSDPDGDALTYHWSQLSGPIVPLTNAQTATPYTYAMNVTTPTSVVLELKVEDSNGAMSAPDQVELTMMPPANMSQCTPWNRDGLVEAINFYPEGGGYSVTQVISGQTEIDLQNWVNNIPSQYSDFGKFEIKSYVNNVGTGETPQLHGSPIPAMPPSSRYFTTPATAAAAPFWTGGHFQANTWYRLDTKINVYRASDGGFHQEISLSDAHDDDCVYQTVYFKIDASTGQLQARQRGGFRYTPKPLPPRLIFSDGTHAIGTVKYPKRPNPADIKIPVDRVPVERVPVDRVPARSKDLPQKPVNRPPVRQR